MEHKKESADAGAASKKDFLAPPDIVGLATGVAVKPPVREPLPGVFASSGLETVYYIRCGRRSVIVDTGFVHTFPAHMANFEAAGLDLDTVDAILTTHFHVDHIAALADARQRLGCPVVAHLNNVDAIEKGDRYATSAYMPYIGWDFPFQPCPVDRVVEDGDTIAVGPTVFTVVHLPGHTPGCTGYLFGDNSLIIGDVVFPSGILGWNSVHSGSNYLDVIDTMNRLAELSPKMCLPSHGLPWAYDRSTSLGGIARAEDMLANFRAGAMAYTHRAARAEPGRKPRHLKMGKR